MKIQVAHELAEWADAAYPEKAALLDDKVSRMQHCDHFEGDAFTGYVASDERRVILAFRGTVTRADSMENLISFEASLPSLSNDFDFAQRIFA